MNDKNGTVLAIGQMVEVNGKVWRVGSSIINGQHIVDTRDGKICIHKIGGLYGDRNRWYVDPSRLTVVES